MLRKFSLICLVLQHTSYTNNKQLRKMCKYTHFSMRSLMMDWLLSWHWFRSVSVLFLSVNWPTGDSCDQRYTSSKANEGSFTSPEYPKPYQPHVHCRYMFEGTPDERIKIEFEVLDLEEQFQSKGCLYDYIDIFTIDSENVKHFENRLCGDKAPEPMISTHQTVELVFKSDYKPAEHRGFKGKYKFIDERWLPFPDSPEECGADYITGVGGVITSPGWPEPYPGDLECTWMIRVEHGRKIILNFLELDLGQSVHCKQTYVSIYNGFASDKEPPQKQVCGQKYFYTGGIVEYRSKTHRVVVRFISRDNEYSSQGFHLAWTSVQLPKVHFDVSTGDYYEEPCTKFHCEGGEYCIDTAGLLCNPLPRYCIDKSLVCNGIPNCGPQDLSDENGCLIKFFVIGAGVGGPLLVIAVIVVIVVYCKRRLARTKQQEREQMDLAGRALPPSPVHKRKNNQINGSPYKTTPLPSYSVNAVSPDPSPHSHIYSPSPVKTLNLQSRSSPATPRGPRYAGRSHPATYQMVTSSDTEDPYSVTV